GIHITIRNETYAPHILRFLWAKIGRANVDQLDRWESVVPHESMDLNLLRSSVIFDPVKVSMDKISDFVYRIVPEGFRVQVNLSTPELLKFIFSENPIEDEWLDKINKVLERPPRPIPTELLEKLKKVPRYIHKLDEKMDRASYSRKILTPWKTYDFEEFSTKQRAEKVKFLAGRMKGKKKKVKKKGIKK
ncbi:MAG: methanogenesis marker 17 protein, partial [Candidatus Helarchaeota archaeon]|nr:methanogenesis marker 17 protein [Candidatus Helarchaeota archaeon]